MSAILVEFFKHNTWANLRLLAACAALTDEQLDATVPGAFGSIRRTLVHIFGNEENYLFILGHPQADALPRGAVFTSLADLEHRARRAGAAFEAVAAEADPAQPLTGFRNGEAYSLPVAVPLLQAIHHATEHRAQICMVLTHLGLPSPVLDVWAYDDERAARA